MTTEPLTLPGSIPGLLRQGSPVMVSHPDADDNYPRGWVTWDKGSGLYLGGEFGPGEPEGDVAVQVDGCWEPSRGVPLKYIALDLSGPTGRAHAAWWLAARVNGRQDFVLVGPHVYVVDRRMRPNLLAFTIGLGVVFAGAPAPQGSTHERVEVVPGLAGLTRDDSRLLPDGSRWVDAEALRRVVLHVAGMEVTP